MEKLDSVLTGKMKALRFTLSKTDEIIGKRNKTAIERHRDTLNSMSSAIGKLKGEIEEAKFIEGDSDENVDNWGKAIVEQLEEVDEKITHLNKIISDLALQEKAQQQEEENKLTFHTRKDQLEFELVYPVVIVEVQEIKCRALVDTGAGSSYASASLLNHIKAKPTSSDIRNIEMLLGTTTRKLDIFQIGIQSVDGDFSLEANLTKIDKQQLLLLPNPQYDQVLRKYQHLDGVVIKDEDPKEQLPIHLILGVGEYSKIKTSSRQKVGVPGEPVAELTKFGWILLSPGQGIDLSQMFLTQTSSVEYDELCRMDVLGLADTPVGDQEAVYDEFKEQLYRSPEGWYETGLPWKGSYFPVGTNEANSQRRLRTLVSKLKATGKLEEYNKVIREQLEEGVVEPVPEKSEGREFYIPHKGVFRETAESTKLRVVYDASARPSKESPSLNDCLEVGPSLQNKLWSVLVRGRFHPVCLSGDLRKAFLQNPAGVEEIRKSLYVDDLISGATTIAKASELKATATEIFQDAAFELHKWQSNDKELETPSSSNQEGETYAKEQLGVPTKENGKLLGLDWDKDKDTISITFPSQKADPSKRGLVSPTTLAGKLLYREACERKLRWDAPLNESLAKKWKRWEIELPNSVEVPRSLVGNREEIQEIHLHTFGDASIKGVAAAVYAVVRQASGDTQGLVAAKSRLVKKGLSIPRTEFVSAHMATNLVDNVKTALEGLPVTDVTGWLDSTVALYWIEGRGQYKQFVQNRVRKICEKRYIKWRHVPTDQNPADVGSRAGLGSNDKQLWQHGPGWLSAKENWPQTPVIAETDESKVETKLTREVFALVLPVKDTFDELLEKFELWKMLRIGAWVARFVSNARIHGGEKSLGPITTEEIQKQLLFWVKRVQGRNETTDTFHDDRSRLNLQTTKDGVYECRGRLQGLYPTYLPDQEMFTEKLVMDAHIRTLHGGVGLTMTKLREVYWIPRLRRLVRKMIKRCNGCRRFRAAAVADPPPGNLPTDQTVGSSAFQVIGVDYAGPIPYRTAKNRERKSYLLLYVVCRERSIWSYYQT
ncbi:uncharacterized protein LOC114539993 [Dendronephthya gigantea]|uniref:uncharacterized protein LOC114539993 n=1 Tax=Dendronephthya gigantea TaxID=151771 RepID=UPI00106B5890|nr:uncharacterized protein LOC114539993 [Dendronephthya gigantea]